MKQSLSDKIINTAMGYQGEIINLRRKIHMFPELGMDVHKTANLVADMLAELEFEVTTGVGGAGVVGLLRNSSNNDRTVALRADMDALPIQEQTGKEYSSVINGAMHACGHDAHTAMLLGASMVLAKQRDCFDGNVKVIFQPAEEGPGGALPMIEMGVLDNPQVESIFMIHVDPLVSAGTVGIRHGVVRAASNSFVLEIQGISAHGAAPHHGVDAIVAASQVVTTVQTLISRETDPLSAALITFGTINGGCKSNVIADRVILTGTIRTTEPGSMLKLCNRFEQIISGVAESLRAKYKLEYGFYYPVEINNSGLTDMVGHVATELFGPKEIKIIERPRMGSDDFAFFSERIPGCSIILGVRNEEKGIAYPLHHPKFDLDEDVLSRGSALLAGLAMTYLESERSEGQIVSVK